MGGIPAGAAPEASGALRVVSSGEREYAMAECRCGFSASDHGAESRRHGHDSPVKVRRSVFTGEFDDSGEGAGKCELQQAGRRSRLIKGAAGGGRSAEEDRCFEVPFVEPGLSLDQ